MSSCPSARVNHCHGVASLWHEGGGHSQTWPCLSSGPLAPMSPWRAQGSADLPSAQGTCTSSQAVSDDWCARWRRFSCCAAGSLPSGTFGVCTPVVVSLWYLWLHVGLEVCSELTGQRHRMSVILGHSQPFSHFPCESCSGCINVVSVS